MDRIQIETTQNVAIAYQTASVGDRIAAELIDILILYAYLFTLFFLTDALQGLGTIIIFVLYVLPFFYALIAEISMNGQSIGKRAMNIKVLKLDGSEPGIGSYLMRWAMRLIEIYATGGSLALISILISKKGQRLGDLAAGTTIVKLQKDISLEDTILELVESGYQAKISEVSRLANDDIALIKEALKVSATIKDRKIRNTILVRTRNAIEQKMGIDSVLNHQDFLETVIKDYNVVLGRVSDL